MELRGVMFKKSLLEREVFWNLLSSLLDQTDKRSLESLQNEFELSSGELNAYFNFLSELNIEYTLSEMSNKKYFQLLDHPKNIKIELSLVEWLAFQAHFPKIAELTDAPFHKILKEKLLALEYEYSDYDLFSPITTLENIIIQYQEENLLGKAQIHSSKILEFIEESLVDEKGLVVKTEHHSIKLLPYKVVYFDGGLNVIGQGALDSCLLRIPLADIKSVIEIDDEVEKVYSQIEVDDFVSSLRAMSENQVRLVLKIHSCQKFSLNFNKMFLEKPCLFTNPQGDYIWAATLEPSEEIYEWLCELGTSVEILDPINFKKDFITYCENKLKKIA